MGVKFTMENSQAMGKLSRMMERAKAESPRTTAEMCAHWAKNISYYLWKRAYAAEHPKEWYLNELPTQQNWKIANLKNRVKIKSIPGSGKFHVVKVLQERAKHRAFLSAGWLRVKKIVSKNGNERLVPGTILNGKVEVIEQKNLVGSQFNVSIVNTSPKASDFHKLHAITISALEDERQDLAQYIARKKHTTVEKILKEN